MSDEPGDIVLRLRERALIASDGHGDRLSAHVMEVAASTIERLRYDLARNAIERGTLANYQCESGATIIHAAEPNTPR